VSTAGQAAPAQPTPLPSLVVMAPMRIEARALRRGLPRGCIVRTGIGPRAARRSGAAMVDLPTGAVAVAGVAGALQPGLEPGQVVVADRILRRDGSCAAECVGAELLAERLRARGLDVRIGSVVSVRSPASRSARRALSATGALVADMESAWLAAAAGGRPLAVVRVVLDSPTRELTNPWKTVAGLRRACSSLETAALPLAEWAAAVAPPPDVRD
jgi:4-hydroxy-3-methylbut-2-en-1-yl diphosphate reductase